MNVNVRMPLDARVEFVLVNHASSTRETHAWIKDDVYSKLEYEIDAIATKKHEKTLFAPEM